MSTPTHQEITAAAQHIKDWLDAEYPDLDTPDGCFVVVNALLELGFSMATLASKDPEMMLHAMIERLRLNIPVLLETLAATRSQTRHEND